MSIKLPHYASPCLSLPTFQVQAYFENLTQSRKTLGTNSRFALPRVCGRTSECEDVFPSLVAFYEGNLLLFSIKANQASIGSRGIKLSWKQVTGLSFNAGHFAILHSVHMGVISANMCVGVFIHMFYAQGAFPACAGSPTELAKSVSTEPTKQLGSVKFVIPN